MARNDRGRVSRRSLMAGSTAGSVVLHSVDATTGQPLPSAFIQATVEEVDAAVTAAAQAYPVYRHLPAARRAEFLEAIATELDALGDEIEEPFGLESNDLPLDTICRSIEISLGCTLGETDLPAPLRPEGYRLT